MDQPVVLSMEKVMDALRSILLDKADYVDPHWDKEGCRYFEANGQPSCIVGHVFAHLGMDAFVKGGAYNQATPVELVTEGRIAFDDLPDNVSLMNSPTFRLISYAQRRQDQGVPWGFAVQEALDILDSPMWSVE